MRTMKLFAVFCSICLISLASPLLAGEATRTLEATLEAGSGAELAVENLAGTFRVIPGSGHQLVATVTVHAESEDLAGKFRFEEVRGKDGRPTLRVRYPLDEVGKIRFSGTQSSGFMGRFFGGNSNTRTKYDGERVRISSNNGVLLYADVEVQLPANSLDVIFRNEVGSMFAEDVEGNLSFDSSSGQIVLNDLRGDINADTGSGDVKAEGIDGSFSCDTGSGDCTLVNVRGETISCDVGSGDILIESSDAQRIRVDTGSGDVEIVDTETEEFSADTGSGDILLATEGNRLARIDADTGSGDVTLRLGQNASFDATADQGSGDFKVRFSDAEGIIRHKEVVRYRRGDARIRIQVSTGSGDLLIEPNS